MLSALTHTPPTQFPVGGGLTFEATVEYVLKRLESLIQRSRIAWKTQSLALTRDEVLRARDAFITKRDEEETWRLFSEAKYHFAQYERGDAPRTTFVAGPNGELEKK